MPTCQLCALLENSIVSNKSFCKLQAKIWNSITNRSNLTVTVVTENLECGHKGFLVYGQQDIPYNLDGRYTNDRLHFLGNKKIIRLDSSSVNDGQNACVFRHICEHICHYVFVSVRDIPDGSNWTICEVKFD